MKYDTVRDLNYTFRRERSIDNEKATGLVFFSPETMNSHRYFKHILTPLSEHRRPFFALSREYFCDITRSVGFWPPHSSDLNLSNFYFVKG